MLVCAPSLAVRQVGVADGGVREYLAIVYMLVSRGLVRCSVVHNIRSHSRTRSCSASQLVTVIL